MSYDKEAVRKCRRQVKPRCIVRNTKTRRSKPLRIRSKPCLFSFVNNLFCLVSSSVQEPFSSFPPPKRTLEGNDFSQWELASLALVLPLLPISSRNKHKYIKNTRVQQANRLVFTQLPYLCAFINNCLSCEKNEESRRCLRCRIRGGDPPPDASVDRERRRGSVCGS